MKAFITTYDWFIKAKELRLSEKKIMVVYTFMYKAIIELFSTVIKISI